MPFKPGNPGGPGRPKGYRSFKELLSEALAQIGPDGRSEKEVICENIVKLARKGTPWATEFVADRLEGKPKTEIEITKRSPWESLTDEELRAIIEDSRMRKAAIEPTGQLEGPKEEKTAPEPSSVVPRPTDL